MDPVAQSAAPLPVVAVVVTHDAPPDRLDDVLRALAAQDHPNLDVLVVETGAGDPTERVRSVLPGARVHRAGGAPGFGRAANAVLDLVSGAEFYVFCHDDAVPAPDAVSAMVAAAGERGADVVGPKLVGWDDPRRFTQFGLAVDKVGVPLPYVERGELDQGQHDGLCDVFAVPGAFTLVRASRFAQIGGFDEAITFLGDDVSLAWRARVAGARVVVSPVARVRHAEALASRVPRREAARLAARHRVRVLLTSCRLATLARVVPVALALSLGEAAGGLSTARPRRALAVLAAWPWNLVRVRSLVVARRQVTRFRAVSDREVRAAQVRGLVGPRLTLLRAGGDGGGAGGRRVAEVPVRGHPRVDPAAWSPGTGLAAVAVAATLAFGSRHLVTRFVPVVGQVVAPGGGAGDLLGDWFGGRRAVGIGAEGAVPALTGTLGLVGTVLGGHIGLARTLLVVGLLPLGVVGAHRLAAPTGSKAAQVAAAVAYAAVPLPYDALSGGRWSTLAAYAAAPWMIGRLARASGVAPFDAPTGGPDPGRPDSDPPRDALRHPLWRHVVATGAVTGLGGLIVPQAPALLVLVGAALVAGSLLAGERRGVGRTAVAAAGGAAVAALLHLPVARDMVSPSARVDAWLGATGGRRGLGVPDLLAFRTGPTALAGVAFALLGAAALPLLVGRRWRLGWAVRGWAVAVSCWGLVWASERGWVSLRLPDPGVLLAPAAAGVALAVGLGVAAVGHDVAGRSWRFGARRIAVALAVLALVASTSSLAVAALDGWWGMPRDDFAGLLGFVDDDVRATTSRVLWIGDPDLLPGADGWRLDGDLAYTASTAAAVPGVPDLWPSTARGAAGDLDRAVARARAGDTSRLGQALAPLGVRYVAVPLRLAPSAEPPPAAVAGGATGDLVGALAAQLDLERVRVEPTLAVYRNTAVDPRAEPSAATPPDAGTELSAATPLGTRALTVAQAVLWLAVAVVALRMRFADGDPVAAPPRRGRSPRARRSRRVAEPAVRAALVTVGAEGRGGAGEAANGRGGDGQGGGSEAGNGRDAGSPPLERSPESPAAQG
ncbi:MAG TPA: glycosyltransferase [Acidimicrobiales bacterium]